MSAYPLNPIYYWPNNRTSDRTVFLAYENISSKTLEKIYSRLRYPYGKKILEIPKLKKRYISAKINFSEISLLSEIENLDPSYAASSHLLFKKLEKFSGDRL